MQEEWSVLDRHLYEETMFFEFHAILRHLSIPIRVNRIVNKEETFRILCSLRLPLKIRNKTLFPPPLRVRASPLLLPRLLHAT